jgi:SAM-dependent methyltransferase
MPPDAWHPVCDMRAAFSASSNFVFFNKGGLVMSRAWFLLLLIGLVLAPGLFAPQLALTSAQEAAKKTDDKDDKKPDVIYVPTPQEVVEKMLELADVKKDDVVYDLGCGDGRIVITAAKKYGAKGVGYDIDPERIAESKENVKKAEVGEKVKIEKKDIFTLDLSGANVITLYLLPSLNEKLIPQLEKLKPGSRIVSHAFAMKGVKPKKVVEVKCKDGNTRTVYLWVTPLEKEKE